MLRTACRVAVAAGVLLAGVHAASALDRVVLKVAGQPGGVIDTAARVVAVHLGRFLEGSPTVIVENVPGAGGMLLRANMVNIEPGDGTVVALTTINHTLTAVLEPDLVAGSRADLRWVGALSQEPGICMVSELSGIQTVNDFLTRPFQLAAATVTTPGYREAAMVRQLFGAPFQIVTGFDGAPQGNLAIMRGEVAGACGTPLYSFLASPDLREGKRVIGYWGPAPQQVEGTYFAFVDLVTSELDRRAVALITAPKFAQFAMGLPPSASDQVLADYRLAFDRMMQDEAFLTDLRRVLPVILPQAGTVVEAAAIAIANAPADVVARARELIR